VRAGTEPSLCLICRVRGSLCAIPLEQVVETMRPLSIEPVTGAPEFVRGLAIIRGAPVPVVDAAMVVGGAESQSDRLVTLKFGPRRVALAVGAVVGVKAIAAGDLQDLPPLLQDAPAAVVSAIGTLDGELLLMLRNCSVLPADDALERVGP